MDLSPEKAKEYERKLRECFPRRCKYCGEDIPENMSNKVLLDHTISCSALGEQKPDLKKEMDEYSKHENNSRTIITTNVKCVHHGWIFFRKPEVDRAAS